MHLANDTRILCLPPVDMRQISLALVRRLPIFIFVFVLFSDASGGPPKNRDKGAVMNAIDLLKVMVVAGVAVTSTAWSQQSTDTAASPPAMTTSDAKAVKQANRRLARDVRRALAKAQGFDVSNVFVRARDGNVTLTGTVPESGQVARAAEIAQGVAGVKSVSNKATLGRRRGGGN